MKRTQMAEPEMIEPFGAEDAYSEMFFPLELAIKRAGSKIVKNPDERAKSFVGRYSDVIASLILVIYRWVTIPSVVIFVLFGIAVGLSSPFPKLAMSFSPLVLFVCTVAYLLSCVAEEVLTSLRKRTQNVYWRRLRDLPPDEETLPQDVSEQLNRIRDNCKHEVNTELFWLGPHRTLRVECVQHEYYVAYWRVRESPRKAA